MINIRVFYKKTGRAKYISHLDISRCMQRAIKRAGLPIWYTQGFNPHIYLTFALPLSLGYESECECMDFRLTEELPFEEISDRLNRALPPDIRVQRTALQENKPDRIEKALYEVALYGETIDSSMLKDDFIRFWEKDKIEVEKKSKKGMKQIDIKPSCEILSITPLEHGILLKMKTAAGSQKNINPTLLTDLFLKEAEERYQETLTTHVMKKAVYMENGEMFY